MKKYVSSTPAAQVIGRALQAYDQAIERDAFEHVLLEYGLAVIDPSVWYPQQLTLDVQRAIKTSAGGMMALVSVGMKIIDSAIFPPIASLAEAVDVFAASYPMNFRDQADQDTIRATRLSERHIQVVNASPHSDDMIYGYVYALIRRFGGHLHPTVIFEDYTQCDSDADTLFNVIWD